LNRLPLLIVELGADGKPGVVIDSEDIGRQPGAHRG
jgi:hypothetical protein